MSKAVGYEMHLELMLQNNAGHDREEGGEELAER